MRKQLLVAIFMLAGVFAQAQTITDTVAMGAPAAGVTYPNQVWYSLPNDEMGSRSRTEWDIAFELKSIISGVLANHNAGLSIWKYLKGDLATGWSSTIDTVGLSATPQRYNSDTAWGLGAIGRYADISNPNDLDWGKYNSTTHAIIGDSFYIVKLPGGAYKKFAVESLAGGIYTFKWANLDGSSAQTNTINKANYTDKNFAYFNLTTNSAIDREPAAATWDITFIQYITALGGMPYPVTGVLQNRGVSAVKVAGLPDKSTYVNYAAHTFSTQINTIGYDWKSFNGTTYVMKDSQVYFVRRANGDIWKLIFSGFGGSANGQFIFSKEKIFTQPGAGVAATGGNRIAATIYPNPSIGKDVHLVCDFGNDVSDVRINIYDVAGRKLLDIPAGRAAGLRDFILYQLSINMAVFV